MTIEQQVADLTTATTRLLDAVNVSKQTLDQKVSMSDANAAQAKASALASHASAIASAESALKALAIFGSTAAMQSAFDAAKAFAASAAQYASQAQATNPDSPIRINPTRIKADFTLPTGYNGASAGPISIDDGVTVVISDGATWSIH